MKLLIRSFLVLCLTWGLAPIAFAQDDDQNNIAFHYVITPKEGQMEAFREAMEEHMRWREQNGETWAWQAYDVVAGRGNNQIHFRSWGHEWSDLDAYENNAFSKKADQHFTKNVEKYVAKGHMFVDEDSNELSAWPDDGAYYPLLHLIGHKLKNGMVRQWYEAAKEIHKALQEGGFEQGYTFSWTVAGGPDPYVTLVLPHSNWGGFADPDPGAYKVVSDQLGEEKAQELFHKLGSAVASAETWIVKHNQGLSIKLTQ